MSSQNRRDLSPGPHLPPSRDLLPGTPDRTRAAVAWGAAVGVVNAALPLLFWWLPGDTVYAVGLAVIASIYVGFAVADGRARVVVVESVVALVFVTVAAVALAGFDGATWMLVGGLVAHGFKDLWQHRTGFVSTTRWWPPFCVAVDWVAAAVIAVTVTVT